LVFRDDIAGNVTVAQNKGGNVTIGGDGRIFAGVIVVDGRRASCMTNSLTIQSEKFKADSISADACIRLGDSTNATRYTTNVTVSGCAVDARVFLRAGQGKAAPKCCLQIGRVVL